MKILCDVCDKDEASYFCVADEAALCAACDHRVHHANKLAGKHHRFSLIHPSTKQAPLCDICQERRGFLFCQQDRAILCKDCDIQFHKANEHTKKHTRFLLTDVKLSATSVLYSESTTSDASDGVVSSINRQDSKHRPASVGTPSPAESKTPLKTTATTSDSLLEKTNPQMLNSSVISTSSISEYLMEILPGWHVEDFLDSTSLTSNQSGENEVMAFLDIDFQKNGSVFPTENMGLWVPQVPPPLVQQSHNQSFQSTDLAFGLPNGHKDHQSKGFTINNNIKSTRKRGADNFFVVPQTTRSSNTNKRSRTLW